MGSYDYTCSVSDLPIQAGDRVVYLLLIKNPYSKAAGPTCYTSDRFKLRCFPIRAEYNDYGSIKNISTPLLERLMFDSFRHDVVVRGTGANQYHDVPVQKTMTTEKWLEALREGRVLVRDHVLPVKEPSPYRVPECLPTLARVNKVLKATPQYAQGQEFVVDRLRWGVIRIRSARGNDESLTTLCQAFPSYQTLLQAGTGRYTTHKELILKSKEPVELPDRPKQRLLPVAQAMVRQDVWDLLVSMELSSWLDTTPITIDLFQKGVRSLWGKARTIQREIRKLGTKSDPTELEHSRMMSLVMSLNYGADAPGVPYRPQDHTFAQELLSMSPSLSKGGPGYGIPHAWQDLLTVNPTRTMLPEILTTVAETLQVWMVLTRLRFQFRAGTSCGPQYGLWKVHSQYHAGLTKIARARARKDSV